LNRAIEVFGMAVMGIVTWVFNLWMSVWYWIYDFFWAGLARSASQRLAGVPLLSNLVEALWSIIA
jgi:hypothetical protein